MVKKISIVVVMLILAGCSSNREVPVGVGSGTDEFPKSPCACSPAFYNSGVLVG